jgi:mono/diheme cytochrome c family protein
MSRRLCCFAIALAAVLSGGGGRAEEATRLEQGKKVYEREKCAMCHSIGGKGNRRNPLDGAGNRLSAEEIRKWIIAPREMKPGVKKKAYELSEEDLAVLVEYIDSLEGDASP